MRCPACSGVFTLDGTQREAPAAATVAPPVVGNDFETSASLFPKSTDSQAGTTVSQESVVQADPFAMPETAPAPEPAPEPASASSAPSLNTTSAPLPAATAEEPGLATPQPVPAGPETAEQNESLAAATLATLNEAPKSGTRRRRCKEEMLARALVSDILVYNRDTRDTALAEGNLLEALGGEIKKSWELYKEKVTPEVANSTTYFREALNEILAEGEAVF